MLKTSVTTQQAADWLEALPPAYIKTELVDFLLWQAKHGHALGHFGQYVRRLHYGYQPRASTVAKRTAAVRELAKTIGGTDNGRTTARQE